MTCRIKNTWIHFESRSTYDHSSIRWMPVVDSWPLFGWNADFFGLSLDCDSGTNLLWMHLQWSLTFHLISLFQNMVVFSIVPQTIEYVAVFSLCFIYLWSNLLKLASSFFVSSGEVCCVDVVNMLKTCKETFNHFRSSFMKFIPCI